MTPNINNPAAAAVDLRLVVTRVIQAPCALVFQAWTDPQQMVQWWSPENIECRTVAADLRIGGAYRIHMVAKDGDHIAFGKYTRIVPGKYLQFTWQWENKDMPQTLVTVEFVDLGQTTRLTLRHEGFVAPEEAKGHHDGWSSAIAKFARLLEQNQIKF